MYIECGGIEVARTQERMQELTRRMRLGEDLGDRAGVAADPGGDQGAGSVHRRGADPRRLLHPRRGRRRLAAGGHDHARARRRGRALTVSANTEVIGIDVERGRIRRVRTDRGDIEAERVVIAGGCWSPRIAAMAGASIPLTPAVHQMIDIGPVPRFADARACRVPDRARHGHQHVRAPGRRRAWRSAPTPTARS